MIRIIFLSLFLLGATIVKAQDELTATKYSNDGKSFQTLKQPTSLVLDNTKIGKAEFKIYKAKKLRLNGYLNESKIVKSSIIKNSFVEVRRLIVVERANGKVQHEFTLTLYLTKDTRMPFRFILSEMRNKKLYMAYKGEI